MPGTRRVAITGAPGAGKTALIEHLAGRGHRTRPEVARTILAAPGGMELRAEHPLDFALAMLEAQRTAWAETESGDGPVIFDRGFCDIVGFLDLEGLAIPPEIDRACRSLVFDGPVFRAKAWRDIYHPDPERIQTWDEAVASDEAIAAAWQRYGYVLHELPRAGIVERAVFVEGMLDG